MGHDQDYKAVSGAVHESSPALTPGRSTNADALDGGGHGPASRAPGKRTNTEMLEPAPRGPDKHGKTEHPQARAALREMSHSFGHSFDDVRIRTGKASHKKARDLGTQAVTIGRDIHFADGAFNPSTDEGRRVLAHELTHVIQQRGASETPQTFTVGERGDKFEQEAHQSADAVMAGQKPTIKHSTSSAIAMRDEENPRIDYKAYTAKYAKDIAQATAAQLTGLDIPAQCIFTTWKGGGSAAVFDVVAKAITANSVQFIADLRLLCAPENPVAAINRGRAADDLGKSEDRFHEAIGTELRNMLVARFSESVKRLMPRYAHATNTAFSQMLGPLIKQPDIANPPDPTLETIVLGAPIDKHVAPAMLGKVRVDLKNYRDAHPSEKPVTVPRKVEYTFAATQATSASEGKLNFVQVTAKLDPPVTPEDVALSIYGRAELASLLTPASPLWGFRHPELLLRYADWKKLPGNTGESDPDDLKYDPEKSDPAKALLGSADADKAVLEQGKSTAGTGKGTKEVAAARMRTMIAIVDSITADVATTGLNTGGLAALRTRLDDRSKKVMTEEVTKSGAMSAWDGQSAEQLTILGQCASGAKAAAGNWTALMQGVDGGGKAPAHLAEPVKKLATAFLETAVVSDLVDTAHARLEQARHTLQMYPVDIAEGVLSYVRELIRNSSESLSGSQAESSTGHTNGELTKTEADLRQRCATLRTTIEKDPTAAALELKKIQDEVKELQHHAVVIALVRQGDSLDTTLTNLSKSFGADKQFGKLNPWSKDDRSKRQKYEDAQGELWAIKNQLDTTVVKPAKAGNLQAAYEALPAVQKKYQEKFQSVAQLIEAEENKEKWIRIGVMIGAGIMTAGFADAVAAVAVADLALSGSALTAVKVGAEAAAFTTITQTTIETDHTLQSVTMAFFQNLATFAMVGKAMQSYKAAFPAFAESFAGQTVGNGGMFIAHCSAGLAAADAKKFLATGKHLDEHEVHESVEEGVLVTIGTIIGERVTHKFLHGFHAHDPKTKASIELINTRREASKPKALELTKGGKKAEDAQAVLTEQTAIAELEKETLKSKDVEDAAAGKNGYSKAEADVVSQEKSATAAADAQNKLLQISAGLRALGGNNFAADGEAVFDGVMAKHREAGSEITISKDPVTTQRVAVVKTKGENPQTLRIVEDKTGGVTAKNETALPRTPGEQKGIYNATEMRRLETEYQGKKQAILSRLKNDGNLDFSIDGTTANLTEVTQKLRDLGWKTMEIVDGREVTLPDGKKHKLRTARFEAEPDVYREKPPFEEGPKVIRVRELAPGTASTDKLTPEQWKAAKDAVRQHRTPNALDLPQTPSNLEATTKLEKLNRDAFLNADTEGKALINEFYSELSHYLDAQSEPIESMNEAIQNIMKATGKDGEPKYLMKGPKITQSEAGDMGGVWRGVNYEALGGNRGITKAYYERLLALPEAKGMKLPADIGSVQWGNGKDLAKLMTKLPPDPMVDLDPNAPIGNPNGPGWWGSGDDPGIPSPAPPTMDAKSYAEAVAAVNLAGGGVLFKLEPAQLTGGAKDLKGKPTFARRPTTFDALWNPQFNPHGMGGENWGKTSPDPSEVKVKKVREVILPVTGIGQTTTRTVLKP